MLVGPNDGAIDEVQGPIQVAARICIRLHGPEDTRTDAAELPAPKAAVHGLPAAKAFGQVAPRRTRFGQPVQGVEDLAMVAVGPAAPGLDRWQQWLQACPLCIGKFVSSHTIRIYRFYELCKHALVSAASDFGVPAVLGIPAGYSVVTTLIYRRLSLAGGGGALAEMLALSALLALVAIVAIVAAVRLTESDAAGPGLARRDSAAGVLRLGLLRWPACAVIALG